MKALDMFINGTRACLAGVATESIVTATIDLYTEDNGDCDLRLHMGGLDCGSDEFLGWQVPSLDIGAELLVRVVEVSVVDTPNRRVRYEKESTVAAYRRTLKEMSTWFTSDERRQVIEELIAELQAAEGEPPSAQEPN